MKIRNGFVSNSSSSSFVIAKTYMSDDQIRKFALFIISPMCKNKGDDETCINESEFYFIGNISMYNNEIVQYLKSIGVDTKYIGYGD